MFLDMPWVGGLIVIAVAILFFVLLEKLVMFMYYLRYNGWWPVRWLLAPFCLILDILGLFAAASLAKDAKDWWNKPR